MAPTIRVEMTAESDGAQYCCFITDANGDMGSTRTATVRLDVRDWTMEYEAGGLRTKRSSAEKTYNYIYNGNQLVRMTVGDDILDFTYDANGAPLTLIHNGTVYYYITNLQGDVISLETMDGMLGAHYYYDAWGKILASTGELAELNPLRYRSYVYDQETGFYYLQSRYYDPIICRFVSADSYTSTGQGVSGHDMFIYCNNNPVANVDIAGFWTVSVSITVSGVFGVGVSGSFGFAFDGHGNFDWQYGYAVPGVDGTAVVGGLGLSAGGAIQITHADTVYDLYGHSTYIGASFGPIWYVGADIVSFSQAKDVTNTVDGIQFVGGIGVGLDVHVADSYTRSLNNLKQAKKKPPKRNSSINNTNRLPSSRTMFTMLLQ